MEHGGEPHLIEEREKYETVWGSEVYRKANRAERRYPEIAAHFRQFGCKTLVDLGIGTGRLARLLIPEFELHGVDIAKNCLDPGIELPLTIAPLWEPLAIGTFDGVICTDVLEHLPKEHVAAAIANIGKLAPHGFMTIGLSPEKLKVDDLTLHLTLESVAWWDSMIPFATVRKALFGEGVVRY